MIEQSERFTAANGKRLRVLHIAGWYPSQKNPINGIFVKEHVKATALYCDVVVLHGECTGGMHDVYQVEESMEEGIRTLRIAYRKSPVPRTTSALYIWAVFSVFRKLLKEGFRPDVIHAHEYSAAVPAVLIGRLYGIPVVVTEHYSGFPRGLVRGVERLKAKFAFEHADLVCPVSEDLRRHIERLGIRARFSVVPNVVDTSIFYPSRQETNACDGRKRLLTVARLIPRKGISYLIEALAKLKTKRDDFVLDVIGDGPNRTEYEKLVRKAGLSDLVCFHGFLKHKSEIAEFMRSCDFFVLPSLFETFGVVLIEALACGKPVIATDIGGPNEIVTQIVGKLVPPGNSEALAKAIEYMLDYYPKYDPNKIARYARERYNPQAVGKEFDRIYRLVLGGS